MGSHTGLKIGGICEQAFLTERLVYIYESAGGDCASYSRCANLNTNYYLCLCRWEERRAETAANNKDPRRRNGRA